MAQLIKRTNAGPKVKKSKHAPKLGSIHPIHTKIGGIDSQKGPRKSPGFPAAQFGGYGFKFPQLGSVVDPAPHGMASMQGMNPIFKAGRVSGKKAKNTSRV